MAEPTHDLGGAADASELGDYRPISAAAVFGLVLGVVSPLALLTPWLTPLPVIGMVVAFAAAAGVRRNADSQTGFGLAAAGLAIAAVTAGAVATRGATAQSLHSAGAGRVADRFLELLAEGDAIGAVELTLPLPDRRPDAEVARLYYDANEKAAEVLAEFRAKPLVERLAPRGVAASQDAATAFHSDGAVRSLPGGQLATSRFYEATDGSGGPPFAIRVDLRRSPARFAGAVAWRVDDFTEAPLSELDAGAG